MGSSSLIRGFGLGCVLPLVVAAALLQGAGLLAQSQSKDNKEDKAKDSGTTNLRIQVTAGDKSEPVGNASVYVRYERPGGLLHKDKKIEMNLRTNQEGMTKVPDVPRGKVLIQVIASGWKTFGQWYTLDKEEETIKIKLEKPPHWY